MRDTFSPTVRVVWHDGLGRMEVYKSYFLEAPLYWIRAFMKVVRMDWEHEKSVLTDLLEFMEFNTFRLSEEVKKCEDPKQRREIGKSIDRILKISELFRMRIEAIK